ncbi:conserved hypothetical protein [Ricinus communis]|uniref:Uncharacterized protein n=1 Tax=Ricinus communis TaxID=3988 RepID=B9TEA3_RICCO|nr:conserved hypothetical protein [Ricinus communis]
MRFPATPEQSHGTACGCLAAGHVRRVFAGNRHPSQAGTTARSTFVERRCARKDGRCADLACERQPARRQHARVADGLCGPALRATAQSQDRRR